MVKKIRIGVYCSVFLLLVLKTNTIHAQVNAFATVQLNRTEVFPEQPIKATIIVSTETWFTKPLNIANLQVSNAYVIPFKQTLSTMRNVNGKSYPSLEFYYLIYPYQSGEYEIPALEISTETPPVGSSSGQPVTIATQPRKFSVKAIPENWKGKTWFVAKNIRISQQWDASLDNLKVGDVIERTITIKATGTIPGFIPELEFEDPPFGSAYPKTPKVVDKRNAQDVNGDRIEKVVYLLEKEGSFKVPGVRVEWWNPHSQKALFRELKPMSISIEDNPDLGMVRSLKDSLAMINQPTDEATAEEEPFLIFGLKPWQFILEVVLIILALRFLYIQFRNSLTRMQKRVDEYRDSELYWYRQMMNIKGKRPKMIMNSVYQWWDKIRENGDQPVSFEEGLQKYGFQDLILSWQELESQAFNNQKRTEIKGKVLSQVKEFRSRVLDNQAVKQKVSLAQQPFS